MTAQPERDIAELFDEAVSLSPKLRERFVEQVCRDNPTAGKELRSLLEASDAADGYFEKISADVIGPALVAVGISSDSRGSDDLQARLQAAVGDAYRIDRELGGGGMSRIFLASEARLNRNVVIKVLPQETRAGVNVDRFRREIQLSARLQNAHIVPVLATDIADGILYYTMPYVAGETLRSRISRAGALPVNEAVAIWHDVLDALAYAHSNGVIHRDIKPENILLAGRNAVVADFGIARAVEAAADEKEVTAAGVTLGTPSYMAPEQAAAEHDIDHRADIYAAGVVMYEMLTGRTPFAGLGTRDMLAAHLTRTPPPIKRADLSASLGALVLDCLQKKPNDRPSSADSILHRLDLSTVRAGGHSVRKWRVPALATAAVVVVAAALGIGRYASREKESSAAASGVSDVRSIDRRPSLAVLPLEVLTADSASEFLADILTAGLIDKFSQSGDLKVIQGPSAFFFKGHRTAPRAIADSLGVASVLTGAVYREGSEVRVLLRLINGSDESVRWVQTYKGQRVNMFALEDSIEGSIAPKLLPHLAQVSHPRRARPDPRAYELYRRGRYEQDYRERAGTLTSSIDHLSQAVAIDGDFAEAYAALALSYTLMATGNVSDFPYRRAVDSARYFAERAITLDDSLPEAFEARAFIRMLFDFNWPGADADARRAVELNPYYSRRAYVRAIMYQWRRDFKKAIAELRLDLATDPMSPATRGELARAFFFDSQYDAATAQMDTARALFSGHELPRLLLTIGEINLNRGRYAEAIESFNRMLKASPEAPAPRAYLAFTYARAGDSARAKEHLDDLLQRWRKGRSNAFYIAIAYAGLRDNENAFAWLDKAYEDRSLRPLLMDPTFADLRRDKRFDALMRKIGLS